MEWRCIDGAVVGDIQRDGFGDTEECEIAGDGTGKFTGSLGGGRGEDDLWVVGGLEEVFGEALVPICFCGVFGADRIGIDDRLDVGCGWVGWVEVQRGIIVVNLPKILNEF